ncbi:MAG TPA: glycosyltransferase family 39 protein [Gemmatimonadaceae bacterium]|nr:glycosyltransferase family 39 protein [Gemmatimonadaceae bacterium]
MRTVREWWRDEEQPVTLAVAAIVLVGALGRLALLNGPMRHDEAASYLQVISQPWASVIAGYQLPLNHLLYTLAAKLSGALGGDAPWALRLPAFAAGVAVLPLTYALGSARYDRTAAMFGTALAAAATPLVLYSVNGRGYIFVVVAYLGLLLVGDRILRDGPIAGRWVAFAFIAAAGLVTMPLMLYPLGAAVTWIALSALASRQPRPWRVLAGLAGAVAAAGVIAVLAYAPILRAHGLDTLVTNPAVAPVPWPEFFAQLLPSLARAVGSWAEPYPLAGAIVLGVVAVVGVARDGRHRRGGVSILLAAYVWAAVLMCVQHHMPPGRAWLWVVPPLALAAGGALASLGRHRRAARLVTWLPGIATALAAACVTWGSLSGAVGRSMDTGVFAGAADIADLLATQVQPGDRVEVSGPSGAPLRYYLLRAGADTAMLAAPDSGTLREILVLNARYGQTVPWAIAGGLIDTARFGPIAPATHAIDGNVYIAERRMNRP